MNISCRIPSHLPGLAEKGPTKAVKAALSEAIEKGLSPAVTDHVNTQRETIYLDKALNEQLKPLAEQHEISIKALCDGLLMAWYQLGAPKVSEYNKATATDIRETAQIVEGSGIKWRPEQRRLMEPMMDAMLRGKIALIEGSTGIGKGLVITSGAALALTEGVMPVVIAAPSIQILHQLYEEWERLDKGLKINPSVSLILGRSNFVDPDLIHRWLSEDDTLKPLQISRVQKWIDAGGLPRSKSFWARLEHKWLAEEFEHLFPYIPVDLVRLDNTADIESAAEQHYRAQKFDEEAELLFTTHAMLSQHIVMAKMGNPLIPEPKAVLLDEAHLFENAVANASGVMISAFGLKTRVNQDQSKIKQSRLNVHGQSIIQACQTLLDHYRYNWEKGKKRRFLFSTNDRELQVPEYQPVRKFLRALEAPLGKLSKKHSDPYKSIYDKVNGRSKMYFHGLSLSGVRHYPSVSLGPNSVEKDLERFWESVQCGAAFSATLYVPDNLGRESANYSRWVLGIPKERSAEPKPVTAKWLFDLPALHLPSQDQYRDFVPPKQDDEDIIQDSYYDTISQSIQHVANTAKGGVLVLFTSYYAIDEVSKRLQKTLTDRLITQARGESAITLKNKYSSMKRPVWLATGAAWTGIDLSDPKQKAKEDKLLTDLVIIRVPFSANTTTGDWRVKKIPDSLFLEGYFLFRQGIGRLLRRDGVLNRRIWVLDGRVVSEEMKHIKMTRYVRRLIGKYKVIEKGM